MDNLTPELQTIYDEAVTRTFINIFHYVKQGDITLDRINPKNKEHLYLLYVAMTAARQYEHQVHICASWWGRLRLRKHSKKYFKKMLKKRKEPCVIVDSLLNFERPYTQEKIKEFNFGDIYDAYYASQKKGQIK